MTKALKTVAKPPNTEVFRSALGRGEREGWEQHTTATLQPPGSRWEAMSWGCAGRRAPMTPFHLPGLGFLAQEAGWEHGTERHRDGPGSLGNIETPQARAGAAAASPSPAQPLSPLPGDSQDKRRSLLLNFLRKAAKSDHFRLCFMLGRVSPGRQLFPMNTMNRKLWGC